MSGDDDYFNDDGELVVSDDHPYVNAIRESQAIARADRNRAKREKEERLEELRKTTLVQAEFIKTMDVRGMVEFCDNVIELLSRKEEDDDR